MQEDIFVKRDDLLNSDLWRLFPTINANKSEDVPVDYPGAMGVPITFLNLMGGRNDKSSGFEIIGTVRPKINGKALYQRLIVRNLKPKLPDVVNLSEMLRLAEADASIEIELVPNTPEPSV